MRLLTDGTPLRENPAFRRLWLGTLLSRAGGAMTTFACTLQAYDMTRSTAAVGGLGVAAFVPLLAIAMPGGSLADRADRRVLVLILTGCQTAVSALLFAQAAVGGRLWALYALVAAESAISAVNAPARRALIPALVPERQRVAALALNRIIFQVTLIVGPALGGMVAGGLGVRGCYLLDTVSFAGALWGTGRLPAIPAGVAGSSGAGRASRADSADSADSADKNDGDGRRSGLALTVAGLSYIGRSPVLAGAFLADVTATFFALPLSLFPAINAARFGGDPRTLGLFGTAIGAGGLAAAVLAGPVRHVSRPGLAMLGCVAVWGGAFAAFAMAPSLWLTLFSLGVAGVADTFTVVFRGVIVTAVTADEFRGRVAATEYLASAGGSELGSLEAGVVGSLTTPAISALGGGLATMAGAAVLAVALPGFRRYRAAGPNAPATGARQVASPGRRDGRCGPGADRVRTDGRCGGREGCCIPGPVYLARSGPGMPQGPAADCGCAEDAAVQRRLP